MANGSAVLCALVNACHRLFRPLSWLGDIWILHGYVWKLVCRLCFNTFVSAISHTTEADEFEQGNKWRVLKYLKTCLPPPHNRNFHLVQSSLYTFISLSQGKLWHCVFGSWGQTLFIKISFHSSWRLFGWSLSHLFVTRVSRPPWLSDATCSFCTSFRDRTRILLNALDLKWYRMAILNESMMKFPVWREELWNLDVCHSRVNWCRGKVCGLRGTHVTS